MSFLSSYLPFLSATLSLAFAIVVLGRWLRSRKHLHLLLWAIGLLMYSLGGFCEGWNGSLGWNPLAFRLWYLFGAMLVAAWLGQGTVFLLAKKRTARITLLILGLASIYGAIRVFGATLDPTKLMGRELAGVAIASGGVRILTPFFNIYGTLTLVGGAIWSAWLFFRKRQLRNRAIGNVLIALGALMPAFGGTFSRFGLPNALYISEFLGAFIMFAGFLTAVRPEASEAFKAEAKKQA
ncbi:MAG TPA: hypothetical protein VMV44_14245 [Rectinemataceae bacterium]|nr:hypothetical protein [Rectinemataceae bacterium]